MAACVEESRVDDLIHPCSDCWADDFAVLPSMPLASVLSKASDTLHARQGLVKHLREKGRVCIEEIRGDDFFHLCSVAVLPSMPLASALSKASDALHASQDWTENIGNLAREKGRVCRVEVSSGDDFIHPQPLQL